MILATCLVLSILCPGWLVVDVPEVTADIKYLTPVNLKGGQQQYQDEYEIKELKTSQAAIDFLKKKEVLRLEAYDDGAGTMTIGYGHTGNVTGTPVRPGTVITEEEAEELLAQDLQEFEKNVYNRMVNYNTPLSQREFDYMVIATFNRGNEIVGKKLYTAVSNREQETISKLMAKTISGSDPNVMTGLENRVADEIDFLFDFAQYSVTPTTLGPVNLPSTTPTTMPGKTEAGYPFDIYIPPSPKQEKDRLDGFFAKMEELGIAYENKVNELLGLEPGQKPPKHGVLGDFIIKKFDKWFGND